MSISLVVSSARLSICLHTTICGPRTLRRIFSVDSLMNSKHLKHVGRLSSIMLLCKPALFSLSYKKIMVQTNEGTGTLCTEMEPTNNEISLLDKS